MTLLLLFFTLAIAASFLCSVLEAVLLSVTPTYVTRQVQAGTTTGRLLQAYKEDIDRPLSAILTLNTIAHTVGAVGVGAQAGELFGTHVLQLGPVAVSYGSLIAAGMTLAVLVLSEIIPKTLGANQWERLSPFTVRAIKVLLWILAPLVWLSQRITRTLKKDKDRPVLTRADLLAMTLAGEDSGALERSESVIIRNLLGFEQRTVRDIMTPRRVAFLVQVEDTVQQFMDAPESATFSRVPVYGRDKDHVLGLVLKDDVLLAKARDQHALRMKELMRPVSFVPDSLPLPGLFARLVRDRQHLYMVRDDLGNVVGLVTMEDVFENLLGTEIMDESDRVADLQQHARDLLKRDAGARGST